MVNHIAPSIATVKLKMDHNADARKSTRLLQNSNLIKGAFGREFPPPPPGEGEREREIDVDTRRALIFGVSLGLETLAPG